MMLITMIFSLFIVLAFPCPGDTPHLPGQANAPGSGLNVTEGPEGHYNGSGGDYNGPGGDYDGLGGDYNGPGGDYNGPEGGYSDGHPYAGPEVVAPAEEAGVKPEDGHL